MSWIPSPEGVQELVSVLRDSTSPDTTVQSQVTKVSSPFSSYLSACFAFLILLFLPSFPFSHPTRLSLFRSGGDL
jgi:hypothetical protein